MICDVMCEEIISVYLHLIWYFGVILPLGNFKRYPMKNLYNFFVMLGFFLAVPSLSLLAQVAISADNSAPNPSAMLDVKSANKGFLPPRMTHAQMSTIVNPANGLIIYCTDCSNSVNGALAMFINNVWQIFNPSCLVPLSPEIGRAHV